MRIWCQRGFRSEAGQLRLRARRLLRSDFAKAGYTALAGGSYKSQWWVNHNRHGAFNARGIHGQTIYIDPKAEMVIVRFASNPQASNVNFDDISLPAYQAIAEALMQKK